jgi:hypothetical protein
MQAKVNLFKRRNSTIWLNKVEYIGFLVGNLPKRFAFIYDAEEEKDGIDSWFNFKGYTFIRKSDLKGLEKRFIV